MKDTEIQVNENHLTRRIIIFVVSLLVAVAGIGYGIYTWVKSSSVSSGWTVYSPSQDTDYYAAHENIYLSYYLSGSGTAEIRSKNKSVQNLLNSSSRELYALFDSDTTHDYAYTGISYLNNHPGEKTKIDQRLFDVLTDALDKTSSYSAYSVFSGMIDTFWKQLFISNNAMGRNRDPLNDEGLKEELETAVTLINTPGSVSMELEQNNDQYYATLYESDEIKAFFSDYGIENKAVLDLNVLFYSYLLDGIHDQFVSAHLTSGYLYTSTGEMIFMSDSFDKADNINIYALNGKKKEICGVASVQGKCVASQMRSFAYYDDVDATDYHFVYEDENGSRVYRSIYYDASTGYPQESFTNSFLLNKGDSMSLSDVSAQNLEFLHHDEIMKTKLTENEFGAYLLKNEDSTIHLSDTEDIYQDYTGDSGDVTYLRKPY